MTDLFEDFIAEVDRTTLETFAACPMQARLKRESADVVGVAAAIGEEGHKAISRTITRALDDWDMMSRSDFASMLRGELAASRPDVQPQVIDAFAPVVWSLSEYLAGLTAAHILRYDGGAGDLSGQLSWDVAGNRLTAELDLLVATQSKELLRDHDYKSGRKVHDHDGILASFQLGCVHPYLVFQNYPECQILEVAVWSTRTGHRLPYVQFQRHRLPQYEARIRETIEVFARYEHAPLAEVPCWASTEKCRICDVAARCPAVDRPLPADDGDLLRKLIAVDAHRKAVDAELQARVAKNGGESITTPDGDSYGKFGAAKPTMTWKVKPGKAGEE